MDSILSQIKEKEAKLRDLGLDVERAGLMLPQLRAEKRDLADQKRKVDEELRALHRTISKKKEELNAKKSTIKHFYSDQQFAKTISNLQRLLERNSYSLSEEKKYVQEINSLNRSKKQMTEYSVINDELQKLLENKNQLQENVEKSYRVISQMHGQIKEGERKLNQLHTEKETVKKDLDRLFYEKHLKEQSRRRAAPDDQPESKTPSARPSKPERAPHGNQERNQGNPIERRHSERFHGDKSSLTACSGSMSEDVFVAEAERKPNKPQFKRKISHKSTGSTGSIGSTGEPAVKEPPYASELLLCDTLIQYLQARLPADMEALSVGPTASSGDQPAAGTANTAPVDDEGLYALPKKRVEEPRHGGVIRRSSSKKGKRDRQKMKMVHNMETMGQFATVMLNPPSTFNEVPTTLEQIKERKRFYEQAVAGKGLESENNSPCSTGTLEDFLQRESLNPEGSAWVESSGLDEAFALEVTSAKEETSAKKETSTHEETTTTEETSATGEPIAMEATSTMEETTMNEPSNKEVTSTMEEAHEETSTTNDSVEPIHEAADQEDGEEDERDGEEEDDNEGVEPPPPAVCLEPAYQDDETESGICSNTESIGAYSRSNSNSDCEPKDTQDQTFNTSMIIGELKQVGERPSEDPGLDDNSNLDKQESKLEENCNNDHHQVLSS